MNLKIKQQGRYKMINYDIITSISITEKSKVYLAIIVGYEEPVIVKILQGASKLPYRNNP